MNVPLFTWLEGGIECTQRDGHPVFAAFLPEKLRSALPAERASYCWGGPVFPQQICASVHGQVILWNTAMGSKGRSMCLSAHGAVTVCGGSQFRTQVILYASAEATPSMQRFGHLDTYGGKFIRASIALYCGSLRTGSSSQVTLSACRPDPRKRSILSKVRSAAALLPNWA